MTVDMIQFIGLIILNGNSISRGAYHDINLNDEDPQYKYLCLIID